MGRVSVHLDGGGPCLLLPRAGHFHHDLPLPGLLLLVKLPSEFPELQHRLLGVEVFGHMLRPSPQPPYVLFARPLPVHYGI